MRILELRGYARAKQQVDNADREDQITHPLADTVMAIENAIAQETLARRRAQLEAEPSPLLPN